MLCSFSLRASVGGECTTMHCKQGFQLETRALVVERIDSGLKVGRNVGGVHFSCVRACFLRRDFSLLVGLVATSDRAIVGWHFILGTSLPEKPTSQRSQLCCILAHFSRNLQECPVSEPLQPYQGLFGRRLSSLLCCYGSVAGLLLIADILFFRFCLQKPSFIVSRGPRASEMFAVYKYDKQTKIYERGCHAQVPNTDCNFTMPLLIISWRSKT